MFKEQHKMILPVVKYRDDNNNPTCAIDFTNGDVCVYYRTQRYGCHETCLFAENLFTESELLPQIKRRDNGGGTLIPGNWCPVWNDRNIDSIKGEV